VRYAAISFGLMAVVLLASNTPRLAQFTGLLAGLLIAVYITVEAPLSGMSMNPARSFASAAVGALWTSLWLYFVAPTLGMGLAAAAYRRARRPVRCAKLVHPQTGACIFRCEFATPAPRPAAPACPASPPAGASLPSPS
jgi:aquaporin Z